jgi:predicted transcriptional regulator
MTESGKVQSTKEVVDQRITEAQALKAQGFNNREIADRMGLKWTAIHYYLHDAARRRSGNYPGVTGAKAKAHADVLERAAKARELKAQGATLAEIGEKLGMGRKSVSYYLYDPRVGGMPATGQRRGPGARVRQHRIVSVLGATAATNGAVHHEWFIAGMLTQYARQHGLDVQGLVEDVKSVIEGGK